jgi:hypothetical protein
MEYNEGDGVSRTWVFGAHFTAAGLFHEIALGLTSKNNVFAWAGVPRGAELMPNLWDSQVHVVFCGKCDQRGIHLR